MIVALIQGIMLGIVSVLLIITTSKYQDLKVEHNLLENKYMIEKNTVHLDNGNFDWYSKRCEQLQLKNMELKKIIKAMLICSEDCKMQVNAEDLKKEVKGEIHKEFDIITPTYTIKLSPETELI